MKKRRIERKNQKGIPRILPDDQENRKGNAVQEETTVSVQSKAEWVLLLSRNKKIQRKKTQPL